MIFKKICISFSEKFSILPKRVEKNVYIRTYVFLIVCKTIIHSIETRNINTFMLLEQRYVLFLVGEGQHGVFMVSGPYCNTLVTRVFLVRWHSDEHVLLELRN